MADLKRFDAEYSPERIFIKRYDLEKSYVQLFVSKNDFKNLTGEGVATDYLVEVLSLMALKFITPLLKISYLDSIIITSVTYYSHTDEHDIFDGYTFKLTFKVKNNSVINLIK